MRYEFKYIVKSSDVEQLRNAIMPFVEVDPFAALNNKHQYTVRSIYFDTPRFDFYYEKVEGIKNRKKVRLRGYNRDDGTNIVFFEIKRKYDIPIVKYRAPVKFEDALDMFKSRIINGQVITNENYPLGNENSVRFFYQVFSKNLRPVVLIAYEREAYQSKFDDSVRVTFDKNLRCKSYPTVEELFDEEKMSPALPGKFILEVKFNDHFPAWLNPVIANFSLRKQSASKYVISLDRSRAVSSLTKSTIYTRSKFFSQ
jgi:SPX domain protein involved in polyphosphate accumulation